MEIYGQFRIGLLVFNALFLAIVASVPVRRTTDLDRDEQNVLSAALGAGMSAGLLLAPNWFLVALFLFYALLFFSVFFYLILLGVRLVYLVVRGFNRSTPIFPPRNVETPAERLHFRPDKTYELPDNDPDF